MAPLELLDPGGTKAPPGRRRTWILVAAAVAGLAALILVLRAPESATPASGVALTVRTGTGDLVWGADTGSVLDAPGHDTSRAPSDAFIGLPDLLPRGSTPLGRTADGVVLSVRDGSRLALWDPATARISRSWPVTGLVTDVDRHRVAVVPACGASRCRVHVLDTGDGTVETVELPTGRAPAGPMTLWSGGVALVATEPSGRTVLMLGPTDGLREVPDVSPLPSRRVWVTDEGRWVAQVAPDLVTIGGTGQPTSSVRVPDGVLIDARV